MKSIPEGKYCPLIEKVISDNVGGKPEHQENPTPYTAFWLSWDTIRDHLAVKPNEPLGQDTAGQTEPAQHYWSALSSSGDSVAW